MPEHLCRRPAKSGQTQTQSRRPAENIMSVERNNKMGEMRELTIEEKNMKNQGLMTKDIQFNKGQKSNSNRPTNDLGSQNIHSMTNNGNKNGASSKGRRRDKNKTPKNGSNHHRPPGDQNIPVTQNDRRTEDIMTKTKQRMNLESNSNNIHIIGNINGKNAQERGMILT